MIFIATLQTLMDSLFCLPHTTNFIDYVLQYSTWLYMDEVDIIYIDTLISTLLLHACFSLATCMLLECSCASYICPDMSIKMQMYCK